jgi:putative hydrolase of the HAD superfamily
VNSAIRCIAFDAVGTLIYPTPSVSNVYWHFGSQYGSKFTIDEIRVRFQQAFDTFACGSRNDYSTSEAEEFERWRQIVQSVLSDVEDIDRCFADLHAHFAAPDAWRCFPDVAETLDALSVLGIEVLVASNFDQRLHVLCDQMPELQSLQRRVVSASAGWHKPSPHFYAKLTEMAGCAAGQILMVGDDLKNDVLAARSAGLQALLIDRSGMAGDDVITDLRQIIPAIHRES